MYEEAVMVASDEDQVQGEHGIVRAWVEDLAHRKDKRRGGAHSNTSPHEQGSQPLHDRPYTTAESRQPGGAQEKHWAALYHFAHRLHQSADMEQLVHQSLHGLIALSGADDGYLVLYDRRGLPMHWLASDESISLTESQLWLALHEGFVGQVLQQGRLVYVSDTQNAHIPTFVVGRSLIAIPLRTTIGLSGIVLLTKQSTDGFAPYREIEPILSSAADSVGLATQNTWLFTDLRDKETDRTQHMVGLLVHDIRSPLTAVSASFEVIERALKQFEGDEKMRQFMDESLASARRALQQVTTLTNDLLDVRKLQAGSQKPDVEAITLELLYDEVHKLMYNLALKHKVIIRYQVDPRLLRVIADVSLLRRCLINLAANALRFSPEGSTIMMKAAPASQGEGIVLSVEDMGPGVPPEERERIFEPFAQAKGEATRGTGLGLTFCREVALSHGGKIWVEDRAGGGSSFCMLLPHRSDPNAETSPLEE